MKTTVILLAFLMLLSSAYAQDIPSAEKGTNYGKPFSIAGALTAEQWQTKMKEKQFTAQVKGKVVEVCQAMGCWIKIIAPNGDTVLAKTDDEFFMPKDIAGKTVVVNADASVQERSVKELKHYAKDAGKSKEEIDKITAPKKELTLKLKGVTVVE